MAKQTKKKAVSSRKTEPVKQEISFIDGYLIQEDQLHPLAEGFSTSETLAEKGFKSENDLYTLFLKNSHLLFGDKRIVIQVKSHTVFPDDMFPPLLLLDVSNPDKPKIFIIDMCLGVGQEFYADVFPRVSKLFLFFRKEECREKLFEYLAKDKALLKKIAAYVSKDALDVLKDGIQRLEGVYFITGEQIEELEKMKEVYPEHWSKVKQITLKKLSGRKNSYITFTPELHEIEWEKSKKINGEKVVMTEEDHLEKCTPDVKEAYHIIKGALFKANPNLTVNSQRYYLAFKKQRNAVIFLISKKQLSIVTLMEESLVRKKIKKHEIKPLTEKVQKFYGGASCIVKVSDVFDIYEVIQVLTSLVKE